MKLLNSSTIGSMLLVSNMVSCYAQEISTARELSPEEAKWKIAIVIKVIWNRVEWICNYGKMRLQEKPVAVIAKHCVLDINEVDIATRTLDYIVTPNITKLFQNRWLVVRFLAPYEPPIRERSDENDETIIWKQVTINSCIPWSWNAMQCWEIKGNAHKSPFIPWQNSIKVSNHDYKKILMSWDRTGWAVTGMSGNIILDNNGKVFWVLSMASSYNWNRPYQTISFEPLRHMSLWWKTSIIAN